MKTPRETLLARHRATDRKLDAVRSSVVAVVCERRIPIQYSDQQPSQTVATSIWRTLWLELILPSRRLWAGLAAVWLVVLAFNLTQQDASSPGCVSTPPVIMSVGEQQRWLNQLFADHLPAAEAEPPKSFSPKPRTEITEFYTV